MFRRLSSISRHLNPHYPTIGGASASSSSNHINSNSNKASFSSSSSSRSTNTVSKMSSQNQKKMIETAACLIIGDEVLNGKTVDKNSSFFAKYCFSLGIDLKKIEVIGDVEEEIIEAARRMSKNYDFVITSGGIGPTHDDITYPSLAKAFDSPLAMHQETLDRMKDLHKPKGDREPVDFDTPSAALTARLRMTQLPSGPDCSAVFVSDKLWVPISIVNNNVHVLPGIPNLFCKMLEGYKPYLVPRIAPNRVIHRILISTPMRESDMSSYLTDLQEKVKNHGIKIGSYPKWGKPKNTVTMVGRDREYMEGLVDEVAAGLEGVRIEAESDSESETEANSEPVSKEEDKKES